MKRILVFVFFLICAGSPQAADLESYEFIDRLLSLSEPAAPFIFEDAVVFTASSGLRRVGVAFAHEGFSKVHWFKKLMTPQDITTAPIPPGKKAPEPYKDSGLLFYVHEVPEYIAHLEYRLIVNGLWMPDPANPEMRRDSASGLDWSVVSMPAAKPSPGPLKGPPHTLSFYFQGPEGERITVGGSFNGWDPFMYELKESPAGVYTLNLPLPPGTYQYVFFHRGERRLDPYNPNRAYSREGAAVSEIVIE